MGKAIISVRRIEEILNEPIEILEENHMKPKFEGNISLNNVYFEYEEIINRLLEFIRNGNFKI